MDDAKAQLRKFDDVIDALEKSLAEEYGRHQSEKAREAKITEVSIKAGKHPSVSTS